MTIVVLVVLFARSTLAATPEEEQRAWRIWLEPKAMRPAVMQTVPGAQRTVFTAGKLSGQELTAFSKTEFSALQLDWAQLTAKVQANAASDLASLEPRYVRNRKKVIEYAELSSTRPIVASAVLAPGFLARFQETLGETVLLVVPSRYTAYVFPRLASNYQDYYPLIFEAYRATAFPVSVEVFEVSATGLRAVGVYSEP